MKTKTKILLPITFLGVVILGSGLALLSWYSPGGMRSNYPAKDNDPKLSKVAQEAMPIIQKIESYKSQTGRLPETLADLGGHPSQYPSTSYTPESEHYSLWIKLGWDPSLRFSSQDQSWTFDPGDGSPTKKIELDFERVGGSDV